MDWSEVGSISPAYRDLNNPKYQKLIQASFTNSKKERDYIKTSNYLYEAMRPLVGAHTTTSSTAMLVLKKV